MDDKDPFEEFISATVYAIVSTYHTTLQATPGQVVFGKDLLIPMQFNVNWARIAFRKQNTIHQSNHRENKRRHPYRYKVGDKVLLERPGKTAKMSSPRTGPYKVLEVYENGTVRIQRGVVIQRVNIRRLTPYRE